MHGVCAAGRVVEEVAHVFVHETVHVQQVGEGAFLFFRGQSAVDQQICHFHKGTFFHQHFNGDPPIVKNSFFAVHISNTAEANCRIHQAFIQHNATSGLPQIGSIKSGFSFRTGHHRQLDLFAVITQRCKFIHVFHLISSV